MIRILMKKHKNIETQRRRGRGEESGKERGGGGGGRGGGVKGRDERIVGLV